MAGALGVGPGVLALLLLWAMALLLVTALGRAGRARLGAVPVVLGAAALTAALLLFPRESESPAPAGAEEGIRAGGLWLGRTASGLDCCLFPVLRAVLLHINIPSSFCRDSCSPLSPTVHPRDERLWTPSSLAASSSWL
ncbi:transmembrane protein 218 isoform X1 [Passer montanus]|uniref:transmembrane protein 218 isoform X1 n=1 Tax=Passer montanus TaxID=9160 RepID=UPI00195F60A0|nr:transmembrane protein 218 isoform X1 [Passer montanus]